MPGTKPLNLFVLPPRIIRAMTGGMVSLGVSGILIVMVLCIRPRIALKQQAVLNWTGVDLDAASLSGMVSLGSKPAWACVTRMMRQQLIHWASIGGVTSR